jgi:hypothetical protein
VYCALGVSALAQQASTTSLIGRVTDTTGAAIPNASVTAVEDGTKATYSGVTNGLGVYLFDLVRMAPTRSRHPRPDLAAWFRRAS